MGLTSGAGGFKDQQLRLQGCWGKASFWGAAAHEKGPDGGAQGSAGRLGSAGSNGGGREASIEERTTLGWFQRVCKGRSSSVTFDAGQGEVLEC